MYFKELEYIKKDDIFWECTQQGNIQVKALEDAYINDGMWIIPVLCADGTELNLMWNSAYPSFKPRYYTMPMYSGVRTIEFR